MATYYRWRKSIPNYIETSETVTASNQHISRDSPYYYQSNSKPAIVDGSWDSSGATLKLATSSYENLPNGIYVFSYEPNFPVCFLTVTNCEVSAASGNAQLSASGGEAIRYRITATAGTFVGYVYSTSSSAYPNGGVSGGYYYDQRTTVTSPTAPTGLTYPNPITTPTVTVSWGASTSNIPSYSVSNYEISYATNGLSNWTVAATQSGTSFTMDTPTGVSSIQFRVRAKDSNGKWSSYTTGTSATILLAPTLTVPSLAMQGEDITVNWTAIDGATSYTVQRKANTDADWTQVYSGTAVTFSETVGTWTSVQYRVCAVFGSTNGGWAESAAIPVVSASALVISGTDSDLGTVINDIPYSISTDTGNQITATITVNSAVIFSGNVGNSTSDTIPVLDLVNGEGTIVIEASVQATGGPVSAVRTWTYTKAPITFPNAGSVAQLTKEGENIFPKTLAECVRLPGGKTLDEVTAFPCQIYSGSYIGTGTYGASNPNTLTFPFEPKAVFISGMVGPSWAAARMLRNDVYGNIQVNTTVSTVHTSWDGNSVQWYDTTAPTNQLNVSGNTYYYIALG